MRPSRFVSIILVLFNVSSITAMLILSNGSVYVLAILALLFATAVVICQIRLRVMLMKCKENQFTALFVVIILLSCIYSCFTLLLLIYFDYNKVLTNRFSKVLIVNLSYDACVWLNLSFNFINTLLYWAYTQRYYHVFWVNTIREIFYYMKRECKGLSQTLLHRLKPVKIPDDMLRQECPLCLEKYNLVHPVSRLPCRHYFHTDCVKMWLYQRNSCPICRGFVLPGNQF